MELMPLAKARHLPALRFGAGAHFTRRPSTDKDVVNYYNRVTDIDGSIAVGIAVYTMAWSRAADENIVNNANRV